ncbi:hypothetical protein Cylst_1356 [Cylindrospermum stagnale PCC 7417]|uniref:Uncharacterized protein n=1 Tax=Cylindrospermum stagnale PCC 7417 TaxID=56107 RepID=K9WTE9_9NOST|nr:hypothetical protein [Cylindrospermum stagnale]AFZ23645.1 hypothetical protein Cylst_1356 [Cylindrospermum stagnale PCC 7417]
MLTSFLTNPGQTSMVISPSTSTETFPGREKVKLLVIGSQASVNSIIYSLHNLGFAEVGEWSSILPAPNPGEVMRILTRHIITN